MKKKKNEDMELAEEHIKIAGEIVSEEAKNADEADLKLLKDAAFSLERAESDLEESKEN